MKKKYHRGRRKPKEKDIEVKLGKSKQSDEKRPVVSQEKSGQSDGKKPAVSQEKFKKSEKKQSKSGQEKAKPVINHHDRTVYKLIGAAFMCVLVMLFVQMASASGKETSAQITLAVNDISILQDEAVPVVLAFANCTEAQKNVLLDEASGYQVRDLIQMLNTGQGYTVTCEADGKKEGEFPFKIELSGELSDKIRSDWKGRVFLTVSEGKLQVKNKVGEWKKNKFQRYDGTYVENDFVECKGKTYYFGSDGEKVTGWQEIKGRKYHFTDKGAMEKDVWKKRDGGKCYLTKEGPAMTGWMEQEDELYYFDGDGMMLTGKQQVGSSKCKFADDGKLISRESSIDPNKPMMALTFDDGPGERTGELLDELEKNGAHATFFMLGKNVSSYKKEIQKMKEIGCEIGNHSYDHPQLTQEGDGGSEQIGRTNSLLKEACGEPATVMRPPYGEINDYVSASVGMPMILWNIDTLDWQTLDAQKTIDNVLNYADDGDIVLLHDIHSTSVDAALYLIPRLVAAGYQLVTVSELAETRDMILKNGVSYTDFNK